MDNFRISCFNWSKKTFKEELLELNILDKKLLNVTMKCFSELNIIDKKINGYACEKLAKTEEGHTGIKITYSEIFHKTIEEGNFTPVRYLLKLIDTFLKQEAPLEKLNGFIARGLRTLTSFLREPDFAYNIEVYLKHFDSNTTTDLNSQQDSGDHTDILLLFKNEYYRIWLFQFSSRGLPHDIERITGKRGELPTGTHVLCPLQTELALEYDYFRKKIEKYKDRISKDEDALQMCSSRAIKKRLSLEERINKYKDLLHNCEAQSKVVYERCKEELDIIEGWFFYSQKHVERIASTIINSKKYDSYAYVKDLLNGPERYLSKTQIFTK